MDVTILSTSGWEDVYSAALATVGKKAKSEPTKAWIAQMLRAEHSPIRLFVVQWEWTDLPYWVSVHLSRHKIGIEHFVLTQREDKTGVSRDDLPQSALVTHRCVANAQAIINISRKRMCAKSAMETQEAWGQFVEELYNWGEEALVNCCMPECVYRGFCPERDPCGYAKTRAYAAVVGLYRTGFEDAE